MIIWLASYPKSGNTWVRSFIYSLLYSKNMSPDLEKIDIIKQYPTKIFFKNLVNNYNSFEEVSKQWIPSQNIINSDNKIKFFKTHHVICEFKKNKFTNLNNSVGAIYIVRDPRNVITSIKNHYSKDSYTSALEFITDENHCIDVENKTHIGINKKDILNTFISSWKTHYNSWKSFPKNFLLIKYEDLLNEPKKQFFKLANYIETILKIKIDEDKLDKIIELNDFVNLQKIENEKGFKESSLDKKNNKNKFFYLGPENKWQNLLSKDIKIKIEDKFYKEMKELNYI